MCRPCSRLDSWKCIDFKKECQTALQKAMPTYPPTVHIGAAGRKPIPAEPKAVVLTTFQTSPVPQPVHVRLDVGCWAGGPCSQPACPANPTSSSHSPSTCPSLHTVALCRLGREGQGLLFYGRGSVAQKGKGLRQSHSSGKVSGRQARIPVCKSNAFSHRTSFKNLYIKMKYTL